MKHNTAGLAVGLAIILLVGGFALYELQVAQRYAKIIRTEELAARSLALRDARFDLSLLLSVEAYRLADTPRTRGGLLDNVQANPQLMGYLQSDTGTSVAALSPDGKRLAVGGAYGEIVLWDPAAGKRLRRLTPAIDPAKKFSFSPQFEWKLYSVIALTFSPDGKVLASGIATNMDDLRVIVLWDVDTGKPIEQPLLEHISPYGLLFSPDGKTLAIVEWGKVSFWDLKSGKPVGSIPIKPFEGLGGLNPMPLVYSPVLSPDGKMLAGITAVNTVTFWDLSSFEPAGEPLVVGEPYGRNGVATIAFREGGKILLAIDQNGTLTSWDLASRQALEEWPSPRVRDRYAPYGYGSIFSPDANLVAMSDGSRIDVLDTRTGQQIGDPLKGNVNNIGDMTFSPDGGTLVSVGGEGATLWDMQGRNPMSHILSEHGGSSVVFSPDGKLLAGDTYFDHGGGSSGIGIWDVRSHQLLGRLNGTTFQPLRFSPDGKIIAAGDTGGITLWNVETRSPEAQLPLNANSDVSSLAFSPDGKFLAAGVDLDVILWDMESRSVSGQPLHTEQATIQDVAVSPDGKILAASNSGGSLMLWDLETRHLIKWTGSSNVIDDVAFSPDGRMLASTSRDDRIMLWDVRSQEAIGRPFMFPVHSLPTDLAFSPDGKILVSGNYSNTITLFDVESREVIGQGLQGNQWPVGQVAFSPDGNLLATTSNQIILWDMQPQSWVEKICRRAGRNFTRQEWLQYFPEESYRVTCPQWPLEPEVTPVPTSTP